MNRDIKNLIKENAHPEGREFQSRIVNSSYPVIGSCMADMRHLARELSRSISIDEQEKDQTYEEILLRGLIIAYQKDSILNKTQQIEE